MGIMIWYTYESQTSLQGLNGTFPNRNSIDCDSSDFIMMIYAAALGTIFLLAFIYSIIRTGSSMRWSVAILTILLVIFSRYLDSFSAEYSAERSGHTDRLDYCINPG